MKKKLAGPGQDQRSRRVGENSGDSKIKRSQSRQGQGYQSQESGVGSRDLR